ncbi:glutamyl-tRNA reductase [cyanobacterium TDX16]|nr:glutamyl-tRNA reductase [cyanobacterium TDX16]
MIERLLYLGATHKTAALAVREQLAPGLDRIPLLLAGVRRHVDEAVIVNTCGRFELYAVAGDRARHDWPSWLAGALDQPFATLATILHARTGIDAAAHVLRVAAGLESRIMGEDQILGQVRSAFATANQVGSIGPMLSALFRAAIHAGRRVRFETGVGNGARSFAELAADTLSAHFRDPASIKVLVIGSGSLAHGVADRCRRIGIREFVFVSRHLDRARLMAAEYGGIAVALDRLGESDIAVDSVISCAGARQTLVTNSLAERLAIGRRDTGRPLLMIDLGVPRNIDEHVGAIPGIVLRDLDMLGGVTSTQAEEIAQAEAILVEELRRFRYWLAGRSAAPRIVRMLAGAEGLAADAARQLRRDLHGPIIRLKEEAAA